MIKRVKTLQDYSYVSIFYLWISIGFGFALMYYVLNLWLPNHGLVYSHKALGHEASDFITTIYFSFITLTTTGYGDVVPLGFSKILSVLEVFSGLIVFGFLISKLISSRQEKIIEELYDTTFEDKISRIRSSLYVYRANLSRIMDWIKSERKVRHYDLTDLEANLEGLKNSINRVSEFLIAEEKNTLTKLNDLNINLLLNSINLSLSKVIEILSLLNKKRCNWKKQKTVIDHISSSINSIEKLQKVYEKKKQKSEIETLLKTIDDDIKQLEELIE